MGKRKNAYEMTEEEEREGDGHHEVAVEGAGSGEAFEEGKER